MTHVLVLANGNGRDKIIVEPIGSKNDKLLTVARGANSLVVRLTGEEWRAIKEAR